MHRFMKFRRLAWLVACGFAMANTAALAQDQAAATSRSQATEPHVGAASQPGNGVATPDAAATPAAASDPASIGHAVLNAGPDPRVNLDGLSRDHAAIFGSDDPDERALLDQERALQAQRDQLRVLERVLNATPQGRDPQPPAMIPLTSGAPMNMPRLAPTPSGSQLDQAGGNSRQSIDEMQRRVNALRRDADALRQGGR
ncbi:hypothetical protein ABE485_01015 [Achromobacter spanius]|uniref:hypothetical protein n=1 Tax=Achromobacter spanius TaxID=217203 RepID=UPI00320B1398